MFYLFRNNRKPELTQAKHTFLCFSVSELDVWQELKNLHFPVCLMPQTKFSQHQLLPSPIKIMEIITLGLAWCVFKVCVEKYDSRIWEEKKGRLVFKIMKRKNPKRTKLHIQSIGPSPQEWWERELKRSSY